MNLEIRTVGKRRKYYLGHSYRLGDKVIKVRVFLGTNIPAHKLNEKIKFARVKLNEKLTSLKVIEDPYKTVLSPLELEKLKTLEPRGEIKIAHLSEKDWVKFTEAFAYDTNAIEGSTVLKKEVKNILDGNRWPERSKEEISETIGVAEAVAYIRKTKEHISLELIRELHRIVFKNSEAFAGRFRGRGVEVAVVDAVGNVIHAGSPSSQVAYLLKKLVKWYNENKNRYPPIVLAAVVHNQFEMIHPFQDGNGRIGRLLLINILIKHKLPPINIELKNRKQYYATLKAYEENNDIRPIIDLILKEYENLKKLLK